MFARFYKTNEEQWYVATLKRTARGKPKVVWTPRNNMSIQKLFGVISVRKRNDTDYLVKAAIREWEKLK